MAIAVHWRNRPLQTILSVLVSLACLVTRIEGLNTTTLHVTAIEGSEVTLICNRNSDRAVTLEWLFHAIHYPTSDADFVNLASVSYSGVFMPNPTAWSDDISNLGNSHLVIKRLKLGRDDGYFSCSLGAETITITITVEVPAKTVSLLPASSTLSTEQTEPTTFTCTVTSKPIANVTWERVRADNSTITLSAARESTTTHNKLITMMSILSYRPQKEHNGDSIRCTAQNTANTSPVISNATRLTIHYPPDSVRAISGYATAVNESSTESLHLTCSVNGMANPNILVYTWSRDCGTGAGHTSQQISVPPTRTMNNKQCYCTVSHHDTGWQQNSLSVTFNIHYHPYYVNNISGYANPITESSTVYLDLTCSVNGDANRETLIYTWSSDCGTEMRSMSEISVPRKRNMNNKECYCTVTHSETGWSRRTRPITFNFLYPPDSVNNISGYTNPVTERSTESLHLTCSVNGVPNPDILIYSWSSDCGPVGSTSQQINVPRNRTMNNKQCYCTVGHPETRWDEDSPHVTLNIRFGPDTVVITGKTTTTTVKASSGTNISLTCTGSDSNPVASLNWYKTTGGSKAPISPAVSMHPQNGIYGQRTQSIYRIRPSRYSDGQQITCEGQNPRVSDNKQSDYVILDISYHPIFEPEQASIENKVVVENRQLSLTCTAWAKPLADITWNHPTTSIVNSDGANFRRTSVFTIPTINRSATGLYRCSANNTHGNIQNQGFNITVHYIPDVTVNISSADMTEGGSTQLECHPSAVPDNYTYIDWTQHMNGVRVREFTGSKVLNLNNLTFENSGEYRCVVKNIVGAGTGSNSLHIKYAPQLVEVGNFSAGMNAIATLSLKFIGNPQPNVTWYKDESNSSVDANLTKFSYTVIATNVRWPFYETSVTIAGYEAILTIHSVQEQDYAVYHATLDNGLKMHSQIPRFSAHLIPNDKPQPPLDFEAVCDVTTAVVSWVSHFDGGLAQTFHLSYLNNGQHVALSEQDPGKGNPGTVKLETLEAGINYTFAILSRNKIGDSKTVNTSCQTKEVVVGPAPRSDDDDSNTVAIAAGVAVPLVIIIAILLTVVIFRLRRQKYHKATKRDSSELNASNSNNIGAIATSTDRLVNVGASDAYSDVTPLGNATVQYDNERNNLAESSLYSEVAQKPGMPLYASVDKSIPPATAQKPDKSATSKKIKDSSTGAEDETGPVYAEVNKTKKPDAPPTNDPGPLYAEVDKSKKKKQPDPGPLYAEVDKGKKKKKQPDPAPLYAEVDKSKKNKKNSDSDEKQKGDVVPRTSKRLFIKKNESQNSRKSATFEKPETGTEYEDVDITLIERNAIRVKDFTEDPYENSSEIERKQPKPAPEEVAYETVGELEQSMKEQKSEALPHTEGMLYADLAFVESKPPVPANKPNVPVKPPRTSIKRREEQTEYASIDHINSAEQEEDLGMV